MVEKARRRRHVPAFGEWNYSSSSSSPNEPAELPRGAAPALDWWYVPDPDACSDVWFRYSPPPRNPPPKKGGGRTPSAEKKLRRYDGGGLGKATAVEAGGAAPAVAKGGAARRAVVVRPVDEDLYQVPPPEFTWQRPRRKRRSLWMGCFGGLNCVA